MPNAAPTLRLEGVAKSFGPVAALRSGTGVLGPGHDLADLRELVVASTQLRRYDPSGRRDLDA